MKKLIDGKLYWIKHNEIRSRCEGQVSKTIPGKAEASLVRIVNLDEEVDAYFCIPIGRDVCYGISVKDIIDAVIVENPFEDAKEDA